MTKSRAEIEKALDEMRDAKAEKYCEFRLEKEDSCVWVADRKGFKDGFDANKQIILELADALQAQERLENCEHEDEYDANSNHVEKLRKKALSKLYALVGEK
jgi:soluble cytochrome b562